ncbi:MAG: hypothetical protein PVJ39_04750 [Gammaproteobacteria bacterium]|jgi:hypothetical protein
MSDFWGIFADNIFPTGLFPDYVESDIAAGLVSISFTGLRPGIAFSSSGPGIEITGTKPEISFSGDG